MERLASLQVLVIGLCASFSVVSSRYCYVRETYVLQTYVITYDHCGFLWLSQCSDHHLVYRRAYRSSRICCDGWEGSQCDRPICSPSCRNGGTCIGPNECSCRRGYDPPRCDRVSCGHPGHIANGHVHGNTYYYGDYVDFSCYTNYALVGQSSTYCQANGRWSASKPQCLFSNTCHSNPCQNGATCINGIEQYQCVCMEGWLGERCETAGLQFTTLIMPSSDPDIDGETEDTPVENTIIVVAVVVPVLPAAAICLVVFWCMRKRPAAPGTWFDKDIMMQPLHTKA